jgi:hypothetical protein
MSLPTGLQQKWSDRRSAALTRLERRRQRVRRKHEVRLSTLAIVVIAAIGVLQFSPPAANLVARPFADTPHRSAESAPDAFGRSGEVKVRFSLPGAEVEFPLVVHDDPASLRYQWVSASDTVADALPRGLSSRVRAPESPGFYRLAVIGEAGRQILDEPLVAVMTPYREKIGGFLNGYQIGTYRQRNEVPEGFIQVTADDLDVPLSKHIRVRHFITHDAQRDVWPKYVALSPLLLDKLELVIAEVEKGRATRGGAFDLAFGVNSGFRTPAHNARVKRAAGDSRHQYGDAADVVMDANGDGRITMTDGMLIALAVERVEDAHPDLAGGLGLYTSARYRTPYVHIDARGRKTRWRG